MNFSVLLIAPAIVANMLLCEPTRTIVYMNTTTNISYIQSHTIYTNLPGDGKNWWSACYLWTGSRSKLHEQIFAHRYRFGADRTPWQIQNNILFNTSSEPPFCDTMRRPLPLDIKKAIPLPSIYNKPEFASDEHEPFISPLPKSQVWSISPVKEYSYRILRRRLGFNPNGNFEPPIPYIIDGLSYDVAPTGKRTAVAFLLERNDKNSNTGVMRAWRGTGKIDDKKDEWTVLWDKVTSPLNAFSTQFVGYFTGYIIGTGAYFVTPTGEIHHIVDLGSSSEATPLTIGHGHKVGTLICDADTGRMFAFGRPAVWNGETLNFYFEVSPKPQLKWYNHGDLKLDPGKAVPRRLAEIDAMARMLKSEKLLDY